MKFTFCDATFSDLFKEVNGFRPRGHNWDDMSNEEKQKMWDEMCEAAEENEKQAQLAADADVYRFESGVQKIMEIGAKTREDALRWMSQNERFYTGQCVEQWVWDHGILFTDYGRKLVDELSKIVKYEDYEKEMGY